MDFNSWVIAFYNFVINKFFLLLQLTNFNFMSDKTQKARLIHLWWFVVILFIMVGGVASISIYNTDQIVKRAEKNQTQMTETFRYLRDNSQKELKADSLNFVYSTNFAKDAERIETLLINNATRQLTEYSEILVKESESLNNTLILWATVLTLLSIIFTFLGFMELRDRFSAVEDKRKEMDRVIENAISEMGYKIQEVYNALGEVQNKRQEVDAVLTNAQNTIAGITDKFEELSISAIEDIDIKIKEIDGFKQEVKENERISSLNISLQAALLKPSGEAKLKELDALGKTISQDTILSDKNKNKLQAKLLFHTAITLDKQGKSEEALEHYSKAIKLAPNPAMYNNRGVILKYNGSEKCIDDFNKAIELAPGFAEAYNNRGKYFYSAENMDVAIENYNKAIELAPDYTYAFYNRAKALAKTGEHLKALDDYNVVLKNEPAFVKVYCKRGLSHKALNMIEEALDDFEKCIELDPKNQIGCKNEAQQEINKIKEI